MTQFIKHNYGWGILILFLWGFFFLTLEFTPDLSASILFWVSLSFALMVSFFLWILNQYAFPKLSSFSLTNQLFLKAFFYACGTFIGYLLIVIAQLWFINPQREIVGRISYGFFQSLSILFTLPFSSEDLTRVLPTNFISQFGAFAVLLMLIALLALVISFVQTRWNQVQLEKQAQLSRLKTLEMQLQPHFLFNTLNAIVSIVRNQPTQAEELLLNLSDFLRYNFNFGHSQLMRLEDDLKFIENYLKLMKARYKKALEWHLQKSPECKNMQIPGMLLQPFVENAIKYGLAESQKILMISIHCSSESGFCVIMVSDNGPGMDPERPPLKGHSIDIIRRRLELLYSKKDLLQIVSLPGQGTTITLRLPMVDN